MPDLANIGAGIFVFGQFVGERSVSLPLFLVGSALWITLVGLTVLLAEE